jgi:hypothetical protein
MKFLSLILFLQYRYGCVNKIVADVSIEDAAKEEWDLVALPGGMPGKYVLVHVVGRCR